ncbi:MAG TPA: hypothetical protein VG015_03405 [Candidatus Dormibacteraeota bacterium]|jgi:hypothetical protein|nr:hypothetical protein [Candidatus Dormibacteraeota bacterium]
MPVYTAFLAYPGNDYYSLSWNDPTSTAEAIGSTGNPNATSVTEKMSPGIPGSVSDDPNTFYPPDGQEFRASNLMGPDANWNYYPKDYPFWVPYVFYGAWHQWGSDMSWHCGVQEARVATSYKYFFDQKNPSQVVWNGSYPSNYWVNPCAAAANPLRGRDGKYLSPSFITGWLMAAQETVNACVELANPYVQPMPQCDGVAGHPGCPILGNALGTITATGGTIQSSPNSDRGVVRLPSCFWVNGETSTQTAKLQEIPGATAYYYKLEGGLGGVTWNFGDGSGDQPTISGPDGLGQNLPGANCLNASTDPVRHTYTKVSDAYHVTATEHFGITAEGVACAMVGGQQDCTPTQHVDISGICPAGFTGENQGCYADLTVATDVRVGQIESIPIA